MAFCPKCGNAISPEGTEKFCSTCGYPLQENVSPETPSVDANSVVEKVKTLDKKVLAIGGAAIAAVVLILIIVIIALGGKSYMDPINKYIKAVNKRDDNYLTYETVLQGKKIEKLNKNIYKVMLDTDAECYDDYTYEELFEDYADDLEEMYDDIADEYGDKWKLSFKLKDAEKMDKDDLEDLNELLEDSTDYYEDELDELAEILEDDDELEDFADDYGVDEKAAKKIIKAYTKYYEFLAEMKVQQAYEVKGKFIIKADGEEFESDTVKLIMAKINGSWVYLNSEDYISFEDDEEGLFSEITDCLNYNGLY